MAAGTAITVALTVTKGKLPMDSFFYYYFFLGTVAETLKDIPKTFAWLTLECSESEYNMIVYFKFWLHTLVHVPLYSLEEH